MLYKEAAPWHRAMMQAVARLQGRMSPQGARAALEGGGTGLGWGRLARLFQNPDAVREEFRLLPKGVAAATPPDPLRRAADRVRGSFSDFVQREQSRPAHGIRVDGSFATPANVRAGIEVPRTPWTPYDRAAGTGDLDVLRGRYLAQNPAASYVRRSERDLGTVLHVPKSGVFIPRGARNSIPRYDQLSAANESTTVGAGQGERLFRGGGVNVPSPDDHVFLAGHAGIAENYSRGAAGMQMARNGGAPVTALKYPGMSRAPGFTEWFSANVARGAQGERIPLRMHHEGVMGTQGMSPAQLRQFDGGGFAGAGPDSVRGYQLDIPARNLGPQQSRVPRGFAGTLGQDQANAMGLRPHTNAEGWLYETPVGDYIMRGRGAFEKAVHTFDGNAFRRK